MDDVEGRILFVPYTSVDTYKKTYPWSTIKNILPIKGTEPQEDPKCETPSISYKDGTLHFDCSTSSAVFYYTIKDKDIMTNAVSTLSDIPLNAEYNISVFATADGYKTSETAKATLYWIKDEEKKSTNISNIIHQGVLVSKSGNQIEISGLNEGQIVSLYSVDGKSLGKSTSKNGKVVFNFTKDDIVIIKIGKESIKVSLKES